MEPFQVLKTGNLDRDKVRLSKKGARTSSMVVFFGRAIGLLMRLKSPC